MLQEELGAASNGIVGAVRGEAEDRPPGFVERRVRDLGSYVAVPPPVGPLRLDEGLGEDVEPGIGIQADVQARP